MVLKWMGRVLGVLGINLLLMISLVCAQDAASEKLKLSLEESVQRALEVNPQIEEARLDVLQARWQLQSAKYARLPRMELFNLMGVVEDAEVRTYETGDTIDDHYGFFNRLSLDISIPIYTFGRISRGIDAAARNVDVQQASEVKTASDLVLRVHELYYGILLAGQQLDYLNDLRSSFAEALRIAEERLEEGEEALVTESDVLKLRVGLAGVTEGVNRLERELEVAKAAFRSTLEIDELAEFEFADSRLQPVEYELEPLETYLEMAKTKNPSLRQAMKGVEAQEALYKAEKARYYPTLLIAGGLRYAEAPGREDPDNPYLDDDFNYLSAGGAFGIRWDLNLFDTYAGVQERRVGYLKTRSRLQQAINGIAVQVKERYLRVVEKEAALETGFESRKSGRALLILSLTNFKFGIGSGKDVFEGLSIYAQTGGNYGEAVYDYNMAVAQLLNVVGILYERNGPEKAAAMEELKS